MMRKIAGAELDGILIKTAAALRSLQAENDDLRRQLAARDRQDHAEKIAHVAVQKGMMSEDAASEYADSLASSDKDLSMVEEFVTRGNGTGVPLGREIEKVASDHTLADPNGSQAEADFANFLLTSDLA